MLVLTCDGAGDDLCATVSVANGLSIERQSAIPEADSIGNVYALVTFLMGMVPNEHELDLLGGSAALLDAGCGVVVVTRGAAGVDLVTHADVLHLDAFEVAPVDTTGAGDAFCGSLAARLAAGDELVDAVRWATAAGALATTVVGAVPAQPTASAIRDLLSRQ